MPELPGAAGLSPCAGRRLMPARASGLAGPADAGAAGHVWGGGSLRWQPRPSENLAPHNVGFTLLPPGRRPAGRECYAAHARAARCGQAAEQLPAAKDAQWPADGCLYCRTTACLRFLSWQHSATFRGSWVSAGCTCLPRRPAVPLSGGGGAASGGGALSGAAGGWRLPGASTHHSAPPTACSQRAGEGHGGAAGGRKAHSAAGLAGPQGEQWLPALRQGKPCACWGSIC